MCNSCKLDKYNPKDFEEEIYKNWDKKGYFKPSNDKTKIPYTIVIPPPNITARLHIGHALDNTLQDVLIRYKRMAGFNTLWIPGTDHASIATEAKIVEALRKEGISKEDLGREEFLKRAWEWKDNFGGAIISQLKKLGCSCDWSRERFTMDEGLNNAVKTAFVKLYNKGLIYKGKRMINWCPYCNTSISDAEVEYEEAPTHLWHIKYKIADLEKYITVATTRPETMLGDTAIAVHPEDERYKDLIGKTAVLPIMNKKIPIIADNFVEKEFGTGCVKITPAHDVNDYEAGLRHNLEIIEVFDENWKMGDLVPEYEGLDLLEARKKIVEKLKELGNLVKIEDYNHNVGKCYRCHNIIEPKISEQWFVKMEELAKPALDVVKNGEVKFVPERFDKTYFNWMENIKDWCISRQLWWGHRIPAYYCKDCNEIIVSAQKPEKCTKCNSKNIIQDEDTLDTWFSSALWPFSTLGWPNNTEDFKYYYPTNTLVTGYDIIFFWVARMIFSALEYTGKIPFDNILIHGLVRDSQGRKMSKSLGNGVDPIELIDKYGTDSLRFSLLLNTSPGNDIRYSEEKLEAASNFANKIWNAAKFVIMQLENINISNVKLENLEYGDKWIISKLNNLILEVNNNLDKFELGIALQKIYDFTWNEYCDWYIEIAKSRIYNENDTTKEQAVYTLVYVLKQILKLLHPFMPFVTERIFLALPHQEESIMIANWPKYKEEFKYEKEVYEIEQIKEIIVGIRSIRRKMEVHPSKKTKLIFVTQGYKKLIEECMPLIYKLGFCNEIAIQEKKENIPTNAVSILTPIMEMFIPFEDLVDIEEERKRLAGEKEKLEAEVQRGEKMLSNPGFINKAPENKINEEKEKLFTYKEMLKNVIERIENLKN